MAVRGVHVGTEPHARVGQRQLDVGHPGRQAAGRRRPPGPRATRARRPAARRRGAAARATAPRTRGRGFRERAAPRRPASARPSASNSGRATSSACASGRSRSSTASPSSTTRSASADRLDERLERPAAACDVGIGQAAEMEVRDNGRPHAAQWCQAGVRLYIQGVRVALLPPQPLRRRMPDLLEGHGARPEPQAGAAPAAAARRTRARERSARPPARRHARVARPVRGGRALRGRPRGAAREGARRASGSPPGTRASS